MNRTNELISILTGDMPPFRVKLWKRLLEPLDAEFPQWAGAEGPIGPASMEQICYFLIEQIDEQIWCYTGLRSLWDEYSGSFMRTENSGEQREIILAFAGRLGAGEQEIAEDRKAFARWFGHDALQERFQRRIAESERCIAFLLSRLGVTAEKALSRTGAGWNPLTIWNRLRLEELVKPLLLHEGDARVRIAAIGCLSTAVRALPADVRSTCVSENTLSYFFRASLEWRQHTLIQREALTLLRTLSPSTFLTVLRRRISEPSPGNDDIFVRRRAVQLLGEILPDFPESSSLVEIAAADPSDFVRQAVPAAVVGYAPEWLNHLALRDPAPQVRAAAVLEALTLLCRAGGYDRAVSLLREAMEHEGDPFVLRVCLKTAGDGGDLLASLGLEDRVAAWNDALAADIERLHQCSADLPVRRWAARARERLWCAADPALRTLRDGLSRLLPTVRRGRTVKLPHELVTGIEEASLGRVLALASSEDFGCQLRRKGSGYTVTKGHVFHFRLWRFVHELLTPSPEKRQAFPHTIGRHFHGEIRTPSSIMAEVSATKVPGEPLVMDEEAGWRPYLPLLDEFVSLVGGIFPRRPVRVYTTEGVTEMAPPRALPARLRAAALLTLRFSRFALLRNWREERRQNPGGYVTALRDLGFEVRFTPYRSPDGTSLEDPSVRRFFPLAIPFMNGNFLQRAIDYFFSVYENSLQDLGIFALGVLALFIGTRMILNYSARLARERFSLVIGGWGTRGKSGTERLKSALLNAAGFGVVSKTTGCEALFIHAEPFRDQREMFIFRPYDKATIWEQQNLMRLADRLGAEVMLWECMGLTPSYIKILQRDWMRDDISTLTNAYPDHEDIQGPAGINIPEVMTTFIPERSLLITSEEQMLPILAEAATDRGTRMKSVGWLESGLLTRDVLARFPYEEHPRNIALVLSLAEELGFDRDIALKEMADRVVPDIGVLKVFPAAPIRGRWLEFINGMSANERRGCIDNWRRIGLDRIHPDEEPGAWVTTVVNNRADRVARSKVFARIIVEDIEADRHVLIGSNLHGMMGYITEALGVYVAGLTLWPESANAAPSAEILRDAARRLRIPTSDRQLAKRILVMLRNSGHTVPEGFSADSYDPEALRDFLAETGYRFSEDVSGHASRIAALYAAFRDFAARLGHADNASRRSLDEEFRGLYTKWFLERFVVIEDFNATGDQIISRICEETPPGYTNHIMGLQNIKGTGLDFVYRWQAWDQCHAACELLRNGSPNSVARGMSKLASFHGFGLLCEEYTRESVETTRLLPMARSEQVKAELSIILSNLEAEMRNLRGTLHMVRRRSFVTGTIDLVESFLDAGDSIRRKKLADRIYRDLAAERISSRRATAELQALTKRQKGGWLLAQFNRLRSLFVRPRQRSRSTG